MRLWHVTLLAGVLAVVAGFLAPQDVVWLDTMIWVGGDLFSQYLAYLGMPFLFFSMTVSVVYLKRRHLLMRVLLKSLIWGIALSFGLAILGVVLVQLLPLPRLIIFFDQTVVSSSLDAKTIMMRLLPHNLLTIFTDFWFLPLFLFAMILGLNMNFDMESIEPTFNLFDSLSRIFFHIIYRTFYVIFIPIFFLLLKVVRTLRFSEAITHYHPFLWTIVGVAGGLFLIFSIAYYLLAGRRNPFGWIYGVGMTLLFTLVGSPNHANYSLYSVQSHKNQNIKRDLAGFNVPFFLLFIRSGSALVVAMSLTLIVKSYSVLDIEFGNLVSIVLGAMVSSLFLPLSSVGSQLQESLHLAASFYPNDISNGLRALDVIMPYLSPLASLIDMLILAFLLRVFAYQHDFIRNRSYI
ncbi:cation:dicarboxylate symporter family transporter [Entomospira culicis]|uniref:Dicarboxylate/amino acid:cation symporter n=1 Tax=Entomospira culicis TaxID=2719989 RepID=A0A968KV77_9SPIO|nr:cation:dicarboxylase symporter family transporter [Entomospira culicis]NIZ19661.1 dicarboxylate/amino acid:cation symporter [Entomospira culicis]NIZ69875.1 dicarboxylate/amino acid:cation symporter [Entomospira culicis]WDI36980.1 cation:dicarboxylase symporter family transporter [Entomospira culicis]WDI38609.1 cation:dicarboxylase symporter family transporter [Entomospira culicis]